MSYIYIFLFLFSQTDLPPLSGQGAQYDNPHWGHPPSNRSATSAASSTSLGDWDQLIIDQRDTEAWPAIKLSPSRASPGGCSLDTDPGPLTSSGSTSNSCSAVNMATGANSQTGHFPANHLSNKANSGLSHTNHTGTSMLSNQVAANRSWGSGPGPSHCPSQSSGGNEVKNDSPVGAGSSRGWGSSSSSSAANFNLNLNPSANPSAWPVLGHEGGSTGGGSSGGASTISPPQSTSNSCNQPGPPAAQTSTSTGGNTNSISSGIGSAWGNIMASDTLEPHPSPSTNVSFSPEPQNLKTDGPNHTKQEPHSPIHHLSSWGNAPVGIGSMSQPSPGGPQVNGEDGSSVWGLSGDSKTPTSKETPAWDSGWSHGGNGGGNSGGWSEQSGGGWGKQHPEEPQAGWDTPSSPPQELQSSPWSRAVSTTGASEGSSDSMESHPRHRDHTSRDNPVPLIPAQDLDPRVLCNTGWGQTPVRQHTSWDMDDAKSKKDADTESWGSGSAAPNDIHGPSNTNMGPSQRTEPGNKNDLVGSQGASGWGGSIAATNQSNSSWGESPTNIKPTGGSGGWSTPPTGGPASSIPKNGAQSWGEKLTGWDESHNKTTSQGWGEQPKPSHSWGTSGGSNNVRDWREPEESKKNPNNSSWDGEAGGWKEIPRGWGMSSSGPGASGAGGNAGWGEPTGQRPSGTTQGWGGKSQDGPNISGGGEGMGSWSGSAPVKQGASWSSVKQDSSSEPTGWEEPSPTSIRRKMEIDDGTSAWGDPGTYNKAVNLWDRNNSGMSQTKVNTGGNNPQGSNNNNHHPPAHNHPFHGPPAPLQNHTQPPQNTGPTGATMDSVVQHPSGPSHSRGPLAAQGETVCCVHKYSLIHLFIHLFIFMVARNKDPKTEHQFSCVSTVRS